MTVKKVVFFFPDIGKHRLSDLYELKFCNNFGSAYERTNEWNAG